MSAFAAEFCPAAGRVCELGSGNGGLLLTLAVRLPDTRAVGVELLAANVELARASLDLNGDLHNLAARLRFIQADWRDLGQMPEFRQSFDLVVSNPPFWRAHEGRLSPVAERRAATHELNGGLQEMLQAARELLVSGGGLCVVLPIERAAELLGLLGELDFELLRREDFLGRIMIGARRRD